jgi:predicted XRE-type DNA-binding protein
MRSLPKYVLCQFVLSFFLAFTVQAQKAPDKPRIIMIGAHPDDPEEAGGTAALLVSMGCAVKFVAVTNGDAGHETLKGKELAEIRYKEAQELKQRGIAALLGIPQGEVSHLMNAHYNRFTTDKLLDFLKRLDLAVTISIRPHRAGEP